METYQNTTTFPTYHKNQPNNIFKKEISSDCPFLNSFSGGISKLNSIFEIGKDFSDQTQTIQFSENQNIPDFFLFDDSHDT